MGLFRVKVAPSTEMSNVIIHPAHNSTNAMLVRSSFWLWKM